MQVILRSSTWYVCKSGKISLASFKLYFFKRRCLFVLAETTLTMGQVDKGIDVKLSLIDVFSYVSLTNVEAAFMTHLLTNQVYQSL